METLGWSYSSVGTEFTVGIYILRCEKMDVEAHTYNVSYLGDRRKRIPCLGPA